MKPAYRRLSPAGRGALLQTILVAGQTTPEATWPDRDELSELLEFDGFPASVLDELVSEGWLAATAEGLILPAWDEIQWPASEAIRKAYEAQRKRDWRLRKQSETNPPPNNPLPSKGNETTEQDTVPVRPGLSRTSNGSGANGSGERPSNGRAVPIYAMPTGCVVCGEDVPQPARVTVLGGMTREIHETCWPRQPGGRVTKAATQ